ncbi:hypothetical protein [Nannocystis pusilla]|uniref:hypothetical protein n=1 Tax=Nannocystis pusilla TaxID=889268 RepID=UPI003B7F92DA
MSRMGGLGDSSPDIWKTLKIWVEAVKAKQIDLKRAQLLLVTTSTASDRAAVRHLRPESGAGGAKPESRRMRSPSLRGRERDRKTL